MNTGGNIHLEICNAVKNMSASQAHHHNIRVAMEFYKILDDYRWDDSYAGYSQDDIRKLQDSPITEDNFDRKVAMWLNEWNNFNPNTTPERQQIRFDKEVDEMRRALAKFIPDHPANMRTQNWLIRTFDRQNQTFRYEI